MVPLAINGLPVALHRAAKARKRWVEVLSERECSNQQNHLWIGAAMIEKKARTLELYYKPTCPYCQKVLSWMKDHDVDNVTLFDTATDSEAADRLVKVGGKRQVPCLFIDGEPLYESSDIIAYLAQLIERPEDDIAR